jgi:hypothetical protein
MGALPDAGWPTAGLAAVVTRFTVQDLVQTLPLALLGRQPFAPAKLPIRPERHYRAQLVFLPVFGTGQWLLMGATAHGLLRLADQRSDLSRVLDVIGTGMLIPIPPLWLCDAALIAADRLRLPELAFVNPRGPAVADSAVRYRPAHRAGPTLAARRPGWARCQRDLGPWMPQVSCGEAAR